MLVVIRQSQIIGPKVTLTPLAKKPGPSPTLFSEASLCFFRLLPNRRLRRLLGLFVSSLSLGLGIVLGLQLRHRADVRKPWGAALNDRSTDVNHRMYMYPARGVCAVVAWESDIQSFVVLLEVVEERFVKDWRRYNLGVK